MKVSDYIINFLKEQDVTDIFGYPGGAINHLLDSAYQADGITPHLSYHEQGAAFAACGYAQKSNRLGVAYSTSGPGATNLMTGIASAYFDSIPTLFLTGQVDKQEAKGDFKIRQRAFQETDIVACSAPITKWAYHVSDTREIRWCLEKAVHIAFEGDPGPVLLDIPFDIQIADIDVSALKGYSSEETPDSTHDDGNIERIIELIQMAKRPVILAGNGVKQGKLNRYLALFAEKTEIPVLTSMAAFDLLPYDCRYNFGFIGTNGHRYANFISEKADLVLVLGNRLATKGLGIKRERLAPNAVLIRVDIDADQLEYKVRENEIHIVENLRVFLPKLVEFIPKMTHEEWMRICCTIKDKLSKIDFQFPNQIISAISESASSEYGITSDIGQNLAWLAQSYKIKEGQTVCLSVGYGSMGYSVPAGIGSYFASRKPVISFCGDGGLMMNIQELEFIKRERLPNKIVCINNNALGMNRLWQAENSLGACAHCTRETGFESSDFSKIADVYGLKYTRIDHPDQIAGFTFEDGKAELIEVVIPTEVATNPRGDMHDQSPKISRELYHFIMNM